MQQSLATDLPNKIEFRGRVYKTKPTFGRVLTCYEILQDGLFDESEKLDLCLDTLLNGFFTKRAAMKLPLQYKADLFRQLFQQLVDNGSNRSKGPKTFDFFQDWQYLYGAFLQTYGIDLIQQKDRMHWQQFISLFASLPQDTRLSQIIEIRGRPMPKATKYNAEERMRLLKLKHEYRLEQTEEERAANMQNGLLKIWTALEGLARKDK